MTQFMFGTRLFKKTNDETVVGGVSTNITTGTCTAVTAHNTSVSTNNIQSRRYKYQDEKQRTTATPTVYNKSRCASNLNGPLHTSIDSNSIVDEYSSSNHHNTTVNNTVASSSSSSTSASIVVRPEIPGGGKNYHNKHTNKNNTEQIEAVLLVHNGANEEVKQQQIMQLGVEDNMNKGKTTTIDGAYRSFRRQEDAAEYYYAKQLRTAQHAGNDEAASCVEPERLPPKAVIFKSPLPPLPSRVTPNNVTYSSTSYGANRKTIQSSTPDSSIDPSSITFTDASENASNDYNSNATNVVTNTYLTRQKDYESAGDAQYFPPKRQPGNNNWNTVDQGRYTQQKLLDDEYDYSYENSDSIDNNKHHCKEPHAVSQIPVVTPERRNPQYKTSRFPAAAGAAVAFATMNLPPPGTQQQQQQQQHLQRKSQPPLSSWDTEGQFTAQELERIKGKVSRLKAQREKEHKVESNRNNDNPFHQQEQGNRNGETSQSQHDINSDDDDAILQYLQYQRQRLQLKQSEQITQEERYNSHNRKTEDAYMSGSTGSDATDYISNDYDQYNDKATNIRIVRDRQSSLTGQSVRSKEDRSWKITKQRAQEINAKNSYSDSMTPVRRHHPWSQTLSDEDGRHNRRSLQSQKQPQQQQPPDNSIYSSTKAVILNSLGFSTQDQQSEEKHIETAANNIRKPANTTKHQEKNPNDTDYTLHDLCSEATSVNDIAWRNALFVLAAEPTLAAIPSNDGNMWTPLHIAVMDIIPPPSFLVRALLCANPDSCSTPDAEGRLPLHLVASSSADAGTMQLLVEVYPDAVCCTDHGGFTPLHMLLLNQTYKNSNHLQSNVISIEEVKVLLGLTVFSFNNHDHDSGVHNGKNMNTLRKYNFPILQRRCQHLNISVHDLHEVMMHNFSIRPVTKFNRDRTFEEFPEQWKQYPKDVQESLRVLGNWRHKQEQNKQVVGSNEIGQPGVEVSLAATQSKTPFTVTEKNPANIPTHGTGRLPIHLLLECMALSNGTVTHRSESNQGGVNPNNARSVSTNHRRSKSQFASTSVNDDNDEEIASYDRNETSSLLLPNHWVSILRLLVAVAPESLIAKDRNGLTPLLQVLTLGNDGKNKFQQRGRNNNNNNCIVPNVELVELLLGKRTGQRIDSVLPPSWAKDLPLHCLHSNGSSSSNNNIINAAMIPLMDGNVFPLHIVADELMFLPSETYYNIIKSIYESYPVAITIQDWKGRTPLHLALNSFQRHLIYPPDPRVIDILMKDDNVVSIVDDYGNIPFDLLLDNAHNIPQNRPEVKYYYYTSNSIQTPTMPFTSKNDQYIASVDAATVYQRMFHLSLSLLGSPRPRNASGKKNDHANNDLIRYTTAGQKLLQRLKLLPRWLRSEACSSPHVQELLLEELATPRRTSIILLDGLLLLALLLVFRLQIDHLTDQVEETTTDDYLFLDTVKLPPWYTFAVYGMACTRIIYHLILASFASATKQLGYICLFNLWFWLDFLTMFLTLITSAALYNESIHIDTLLRLGTAVTGLLWLCVIGYLKKWWYGMAIFIGGFTTIASRYLFAAVLVGGMLIVAFAQMFYTRFQLECFLNYFGLGGTDDYYRGTSSETTTNTATPPPVCTVRDSYRVVYLLLRGDHSAFPENGVDSEQHDNETAVLISLLIFFFIVLLIACLTAILLSTFSLDYDKIGRSFFWDPKLAFIIATLVTREETSVDDSRSSSENGITRSTQTNLDTTTIWLEKNWEMYMNVLVGGEIRNRMFWYANRSSTSCWLNILGWPILGKIAAALIILLWIVTGLFTLGLLWPPQVRRFLFRPTKGCEYEMNTKSNRNSSLDLQENSRLYGLHNELYQIKLMSYSQSISLERDLNDMKDLFSFALREADKDIEGKRL